MHEKPQVCQIFSLSFVDLLEVLNSSMKYSKYGYDVAKLLRKKVENLSPSKFSNLSVKFSF